jgi:hypothetical protein
MMGEFMFRLANKTILFAIAASTLFAHQLKADVSVYNVVCSDPSEPTCLMFLSSDSEGYSFQSCRSEVQSYIDDLKEWQECVANEAHRIAREAAGEIVDKFNCKAEGGICF